MMASASGALLVLSGASRTSPHVVAFSRPAVLERLRHALSVFQSWNYNDAEWNSEHLARLIATGDAVSYRNRWFSSHYRNTSAERVFRDHLSAHTPSLLEKRDIDLTPGETVRSKPRRTPRPRRRKTESPKSEQGSISSGSGVEDLAVDEQDTAKRALAYQERLLFGISNVCSASSRTWILTGLPQKALFHYGPVAEFCFTLRHTIRARGQNFAVPSWRRHTFGRATEVVPKFFHNA